MISKNKNPTYFYNLINDNDSLHSLVSELNIILIRNYINLEPISIFSDSEIKSLVNVITRSNMESFGIPLYPNTSDKLSFIFYSLVKGHYLGNGNKRTAALILAYLILAYKNVDERFNIDENELSELFTKLAEKAITIANSLPIDKEFIINDLKAWFINIL